MEICSAGGVGVGGARWVSLVGPRAAGGMLAPQSCALLGAMQKAAKPSLLLRAAVAQALVLGLERGDAVGERGESACDAAEAGLDEVGGRADGRVDLA